MPKIHESHLAGNGWYCLKCGACECHAPMSFERECPVA